jgi:hypothetical protein
MSKRAYALIGLLVLTVACQAPTAPATALPITQTSLDSLSGPGIARPQPHGKQDPVNRTIR